MRPSRGLLRLSLALCFVVTACGQAPSIDLQNSPLPIPGGNSGKPSKPGSGNGEDGGDISPGATPLPGATPVASPTPMPAPVESDRLACVASTTGTLISFSSLIGPRDFGREITLVEVGSDTPPAEEVTRNDANIYLLDSPLIVRSLDIDRIHVLTIAKRSTSRGYLAPQIYSTVANLSYRLGIVTRIGSPVEASEGAQALARRMKLPLRSHGVSLQGHYLLVPSRGGTLNVLDSATLKTVGELPVDPRVNFFPQFDEDAGLLSVLRYQNGVFVPVFVSTSIRSGRVSVSGPVFTASLLRGMSASPPVLAGGFWVWGEQAPGHDDRISVGSFNFGNAGESKASFDRLTLAPFVDGARVYPQVAPVRGQDGRWLVAVAYERVVRASAGRVPYKVEAAHLALVDLRSADKGQVVANIRYPSEVMLQLSKYGLEQARYAVSAVLGSSDMNSVYVSLPTLYGPQAYRLKGESMLEGVSKETCSQLSVQWAK